MTQHLKIWILLVFSHYCSGVSQGVSAQHAITDGDHRCNTAQFWPHPNTVITDAGCGQRYNRSERATREGNHRQRGHTWSQLISLLYLCLCAWICIEDQTSFVWKNEFIFVIFFLCRGNWIGEAPYRVGIPCSACPSSYGGTCSNNMCFPAVQSNFMYWFKWGMREMLAMLWKWCIIVPVTGLQNMEIIVC